MMASSKGMTKQLFVKGGGAVQDVDCADFIECLFALLQCNSYLYFCLFSYSVMVNLNALDKAVRFLV